MALNNELSVNTGLPASPLTQNPELFTELQKVYNAIRAIGRALDAYTGALPESKEYWDQTGLDRCTFGLNSKIYLEAGEDLSAGALVGIKSDGKVWKAVDGTVRCFGFCSASGGTLTGATTEVTVMGLYPKLPAATLVPGDRYYNSTVAGQLGVSGSGPTWNQVVGFAISDTNLFFIPQLNH
jgi:hypothetical protein